MKSSLQMQALSARLLEHTAVTKTQKVPCYPRILSAADKLISGRATTMAAAIRMAALEPTAGMTELVMDLTIGYFVAWKGARARPVGFLTAIENGTLVAMRHAAHAKSGAKHKLTRDGFERIYMKERKTAKVVLPAAVKERVTRGQPRIFGAHVMKWSEKPAPVCDLPLLAFPY